MAFNNLQFVVCYVLLVNFSVCVQDYVSFNKIVTENNLTPEFAKYTLVKPKIYHGREKREISTTKEDDGSHVHDLKITLEINGKEHLLNLKLNRELIPKGYFHRYQHKGKSVVKKPKINDIELCQYQGSLNGVEHSWAAISTCDNKLSGVIFDGNELHYIESTRKSNSSKNDLENFNDHYLYKHSDLMEKKKCGYEGSNISPLNASSSEAIIDNREFNRILRYKRSDRSASHKSNIRGPYNANKRSRYVELVMVVDQLEYKKQESNLRTVNNRCKNIANIINALYSPLNIFIALVGVVVWTEVDEIKISENGDTTLTSFLHYRRERLIKEHPNDNAQLLTGIQFGGGVVGKALKGPICTYEFSGGVSMDHSSTVGLVATTIAHEMGHNFGMEHDTNECNCPDERCIMSPSSSSLSPKHWSSCSLEYLANAFEHGMDYCLRNKPENLFDSPVCGNGFVEPGEQCDCGIVDNCKNPCCNATTCMLHSNASCATGECCDLLTCRPKIAGTLCRSADHECDLPEYCTGQSEYCPNDVYKMDTETCDGGKAFCYQGSCRTRSDQCKILWGPSGSSSDECYKLNNKGTRHGNCGYNRLNSSYIKCRDDNVFCGMLHCRHLNEKLEFGMESVAIISHTFINSKGSIIPCRNALVDLGLNEVDPGLTPDGAKCGDGKMCINQKCMPVENLRKSSIVSCPSDCNGNGYCNSKGHCHCKDDFAPPNCDYPGVGGSVDSGPASDPNANRDFVTAMYIIFLGIIPLIALMSLFVYYNHRNHIIVWPKRSSGGKPSKSTSDSTRGHPIFPTAPQLSEIRNDDNSSLLPHSSSSHIANGFSNNFFGHFKGFIITPISKPTDENTPSTIMEPSPANHSDSTFLNNDSKVLPQRSAPPPPVVPNISFKLPKPVSRSRTIHGNKPTLSVKPLGSASSNTDNNNSINSVLSSVNVISTVPASNVGGSRPLISDPILETSTCTAKELLSPLKNAPKLPIRPAPAVPTITSTIGNRPLSSPNIAMNAIAIPPESEKKSKDTGGTTLNRIASFLKSKNDKSKMNPEITIVPQNVNVKPKKISDKIQLKNIEISSPILQSQVEIPVSTLPIDQVDALDKKIIVMRAQSMRTGEIVKKPNIPTFGSMRQPSNHAKRPTSIPAANRPTSPPPPRPPPISDGKFTKSSTAMNHRIPENMYSDCMVATPNTDNKTIGDNDSPSSTDNIYAVIEENIKPMNENFSPKSDPITTADNNMKPFVNRSNSGSTESMGLLGEIVSEIQNRNFDSIYSTSTLNRKREAMKQKSIEQQNENLAKNNFTINSSQGSYANTTNNTPIYKSPESIYSNLEGNISSAVSTTSSGYLHPSAVNTPKLNPSGGLDVKSTYNTPTATSVDSKKSTTDELVNHKPFSSTFQRKSGPLASAYSNINNEKAETKPKPTISNKVDDKKPASKPPTTLKKQITPPNLKGVQKNPTNSTSRGVIPKNLPKTGQKTDNSPDLVSSCATNNSSTTNSPDIVNNSDTTQKTNLSKTSSVSKPLNSKPVNNSGATKLLRDKSPASGGINNTTVKKIGAINKSLSGTNKPSTVAKPIKNTLPPIATRNTPNKLSNVASLQQKFEANKSVSNNNKIPESKRTVS
ncbi:disintegrin and metalloproteinase domain-containing protein 12-like [Chrysoperla carnea]|uniref:disintegrin and metalloproteinase domain-containing protein 12-like n=1 Tax=Chrysoperla carnea TaxID=189513 RepID=UPI001D06CDF2|nr:disintegrin and metalloproteinase domain-containing protein 12-like [Chrysoperla carnea]